MKTTTKTLIEELGETIAHTEDNKEWIQWAARTEGDNIRREESTTTDSVMASIEWTDKKNKRGQIEKLQRKLKAMMKQTYEQEMKQQGKNRLIKREASQGGQEKDNKENTQPSRIDFVNARNYTGALAIGGSFYETNIDITQSFWVFR